MRLIDRALRTGTVGCEGGGKLKRLMVAAGAVPNFSKEDDTQKRGYEVQGLMVP